jgi:REP element-mobilizing transposase RayT
LCELFVEELKILKQLKSFDLCAWCLLSDHFHMMVQPMGDDTISEIMHSLKRNFSRDANKVMGNEIPKSRPICFTSTEGDHPNGRCVERKTIGGSRTKNGNGIISGADMDPRLWDEMNKLDAKILRWHQQFHSNPSSISIPPFQLQKSFHDHVIHDEKDFEKHWYYTTYNYLKHGLAEDWAWTSEK